MTQKMEMKIWKKVWRYPDLCDVELPMGGISKVHFTNMLTEVPEEMKACKN